MRCCMASRGIVLAATIAALLPTSGVAASITYGFTEITSPPTGTKTAGQYTVTLFETGDKGLSKYGGAIGANQILFVFQNSAKTASSIADVYFQDGTLLDLASVRKSSGVSFTAPAKPNDIPGGKNLSPDFVTTKDFSADSDSPVSANGVNASTEWLGVLFDLKSGKTYADTVKALANALTSPGKVWDDKSKSGYYTGSDALEGLRVGIHVQSIADINGGSAAFVNGVPIIPVDPNVDVPEPTSVALFAIGAAGLTAVRRYRRRNSAMA